MVFAVVTVARRLQREEISIHQEKSRYSKSGKAEEARTQCRIRLMLLMPRFAPLRWSRKASSRNRKRRRSMLRQTKSLQQSKLAERKDDNRSLVYIGDIVGKSLAMKRRYVRRIINRCPWRDRAAHTATLSELLTDSAIKHIEQQISANHYRSLPHLGIAKRLFRCRDCHAVWVAGSVSKGFPKIKSAASMIIPSSGNLAERGDWTENLA
jgi:hypothetical protein